MQQKERPEGRHQESPEGCVACDRLERAIERLYGVAIHRRAEDGHLTAYDAIQEMVLDRMGRIIFAAMDREDRRQAVRRVAVEAFSKAS